MPRIRHRATREDGSRWTRLGYAARKATSRRRERAAKQARKANR